jgi:hypothetical protein
MEIGFPVRKMICGEMYFLGKKSGGWVYCSIFNNLKSFALFWMLWKESICYQITPWSWTLLERPPALQQLKNFPTFYGTRRSNTMFIRALHWSLAWDRWDQFDRTNSENKSTYFTANLKLLEEWQWMWFSKKCEGASHGNLPQVKNFGYHCNSVYRVVDIMDMPGIRC